MMFHEIYNSVDSDDSVITSCLGLLYIQYLTVPQLIKANSETKSPPIGGGKAKCYAAQTTPRTIFVHILTNC